MQKAYRTHLKFYVKKMAGAGIPGCKSPSLSTMLDQSTLSYRLRVNAK